MRVIAYIRVSTREQAEKGYSIGEQEERLRAYCTAKDWLLVDVVSDLGISGAKMERPGLQRVIAAANRGLCDAVLVWKLDRLSRSQKDTLCMIEDVFLKNDVAFISMNENFDTSTAFGRAMIGILSVFAQLEREQIRERMMIGKEGRAKAGKYHGGMGPIGYTFVTKEQGGAGLVVDEYEALQVRDAYARYLSGWSQYKVFCYLRDTYTTKFGVWSQATLRSVLTSPLYTGKVKFSGQYYDGIHEPIISVSDFDAVQARMEALKWQPTERQTENGQRRPWQSTSVLGGVLFCARCGARFMCDVSAPYVNKKGERKQHAYYVCYSRKKPVKHMIKDPNCKNDRWLTEKLEGVIFGQIAKLSLDADAFEEVVRPVGLVCPAERLAALMAQRDALHVQVERLLDLCQSGRAVSNMVAERLGALQVEIEAVDMQISEVPEPSEADETQIDAAVELLSSAAVVLEHGSRNEKRELVHGLIRRIEIDGEQVHIYWKFAPSAASAPLAPLAGCASAVPALMLAT